MSRTAQNRQDQPSAWWHAVDRFVAAHPEHKLGIRFEGGEALMPRAVCRLFFDWLAEKGLLPRIGRRPRGRCSAGGALRAVHPAQADIWRGPGRCEPRVERTLDRLNSYDRDVSYSVSPIARGEGMLA
jgi:hypothetical protein